MTSTNPDSWSRRLASVVGCIVLTASAVATAALNAGDTAPDFQAPAALDGKQFSFSLQNALKRGPVVVYFYPSAYTRGCNLQARKFAENHEKFAAAGATVIGVSLDNIDRLKEFSADPEYCAGKVPVASDAGGSIARAYALNIREATVGRTDTRGAAITHGSAERTTFIVTPDGKIATTLSALTPIENVEKSLEFVESYALTANTAK